MKQTVTLLVFLLTMLSSCCNKTSSKLTENNPLDSLVLVDTVQMKTAFLSCIHDFVKQYPKDSTFILKAGYGYEDHGVISRLDNKDVIVDIDTIANNTMVSISTMTSLLSNLLIMMLLWEENGLLKICILLIISRLTIVLSSSVHVQIPS